MKTALKLARPRRSRPGRGGRPRGHPPYRSGSRPGDPARGPGHRGTHAGRGDRLRPGRGLAGLRLELVQGDLTHVIEERSYRPLPPWALTGERTEHDEIDTVVGRESLPELREGEAVLRATATRPGTWLRHPDPTVLEVRLPVRLYPPELSVLSTHNYVTQGGAGVVVYRVGETSVRDGVQAGEWFFPGAALPGGGPGDRFCLFGVPWDLDDEAGLRLAAEDDVANRAEVAFVDRFFPKPPATRPHPPLRLVHGPRGPGDPAPHAGSLGPRRPARELPPGEPRPATDATPRSSSSWPGARPRTSCGPSRSCPSPTPR